MNSNAAGSTANLCCHQTSAAAAVAGGAAGVAENTFDGFAIRPL